MFLGKIKKQALSGSWKNFNSYAGSQNVDGSVDEIDITPPESITWTKFEQVERHLNNKIDDFKIDITTILDTVIEKLKQISLA